MTAILAKADNIKIDSAPYRNQMIPANALASMVHKLWKAEYVPMAVATSFLSEILLIQAFEMPSVAAA